MNKARELCKEVKELAKKYDLPFFFVTDGASITSNTGCEAVRHARTCHIEWEKENGLNPEEDWGDIPDSVLEYGFDFDWDEKDVWKLDCETTEIDISKLDWHFEVPFWDFNGGTYNLTPNEVIENPDNYKDHYDRIMQSDINYPIDVMENKGRLVILDGLHRLVKYRLLNKDKIKVRIIPRTEINKIAK